MAPLPSKGIKSPSAPISFRHHYRGVCVGLLKSHYLLFHKPLTPIISCVIKCTQSHNAPTSNRRVWEWWWAPAETPLIKTEVAVQSSAIALSPNPSSSPRPSLQSQEHNVQSLNSSRPRLRGSLPLYTLPQCKHLIKIAWAVTIATKCNSRIAALWSLHRKSCVSQSWGKWQAPIAWLCCATSRPKRQLRAPI